MQLRVIPFKRNDKLAMARAFGVSKATYGWVGRSPTQEEAKKVTTQVWKAAGSVGSASPNLRNVLEGGTLNLEAVIGCRQTSLLARRYERQGGDIQWHRATGTLAGALRKTMKRWGWQETAPWKWHHEKLSKAVDLTTGAESPAEKKS